jgi:ABC-type phosphate/phosphonate transport system substrate-binding protein
MKSVRTSALGLLALSLSLLVTSGSPMAQANEPPVQVGIVQSVFTDVPPVLVNFLTPQFNSLVKEFTGLQGQMVVSKNQYTLAQAIEEGKIQFGVFHGVEFGWAQQKHPDLKPLMIAVYKHRKVHAHLMVRDDVPIKSFADLKGQNIAMPSFTKEHCRLFVGRCCKECAQCEPMAFFAKITKPDSSETALDEVVGGLIAAAIVDTASLESYQNVKPGCCNRLRALKVSENFPVAVIAYKEGAVSEKIVTRFQQGMVNANKSERGRDMMNLFKISSFEPIPNDYADQVAEIVKAYPPPVK